MMRIKHRKMQKLNIDDWVNIELDLGQNFVMMKVKNINVKIYLILL